MKKSGIIGSLLVPFCILMLDKTAVFAAGDDEPPRLEQLFSTLEIVFDKLSPIAGILCIIFIVLGGYMWMTSAGDPIKIKKAQGTLTWAIIGLVFIVISGIILSVILNLVD